MSKKNKTKANVNFKYDENGLCPEFTKYLESLGILKNPFECSYLKILPEKVSIIKYVGDSPSSRYEKGELVCIARTKTLNSNRCNLSGKLRIGGAGDLEAECEWPLKDKVIINFNKI